MTAQKGFGLVGIIVITIIVGVVLTVGYGVIQQNFFTKKKEVIKESKEVDDRSLTLVPASPSSGSIGDNVVIPNPTFNPSPTPLARTITQIAPLPSGSSNNLATTPLVQTEEESVVPLNEYIQWSSKRTTLWGDVELGLKITAPVWMESRGSTNAQWLRSEPTVSSGFGNYGPKGDEAAIMAVYVPGFRTYSVNILTNSYRNSSFETVGKELVVGGGFCSTSVENRSQVLANIKVEKQISVGKTQAELRIMNEVYSQEHDCRSTETWIIKAKNGQFIISELSPEDAPVRLEAF